jgi:protein-disulfide isomerase
MAEDKKRGSIFVNALAGLSVLCAVAVTWRLYFPPRAPTPASAKPVFVPEWKQYAEVGHRFGASAPKVTIVEFSDFECPVCRVFTLNALRTVLPSFPNEVAVVYRHWPLAYHRFSYPAARAAECAAAQGQFEPFHYAAFQGQDSLGLLRFEDLAARAGVPDSTKFAACVNLPGNVAAIDADSAAARAIGGSGTPTILLNGWRLPGAPDSAMLHRMITVVLGGGTLDTLTMR